MDGERKDGERKVEVGVRGGVGVGVGRGSISAAKGTSAVMTTYPVKGSFANGADWDRSIVND